MSLQDKSLLWSSPPRATPLAMIDPVNLNESFSLDALWSVDAVAYQKQLKIAVTIPR
jgi:hypothetical protein